LAAFWQALFLDLEVGLITMDLDLLLDEADHPTYQPAGSPASSATEPALPSS
jgi:hypothetical protein